MPSAINVTESIRAFILERFPRAQQTGLTDQDSLLESGLVDSMGILEIVTHLEEEFQIVFADEEVVSENFESIAALARLVESKSAG